MSNDSKSSGYNSQSNKTISRFDRGSVDILRHFSSSNSSVISLQILCLALLDVYSLHLTDNDPIKSRLLFQLQLHFLQTSKILPTSMSLTAGSIRQLPLFQNYVRILRESIQTALSVVQRPPSSSDKSSIVSLLDEEYTKVVLSKAVPANISIDIPQPDIQLKIPLPLTTNGTGMVNGFDNIVVFRYVQDFYEVGKLGKGGFGSVFRARNRLDDRMYAIKKIVFNENTDRTRRQAKRALREVRVLASLSHPNIVQYHCAWIELVPVDTRTRRTTSSSSSTTQVNKSLPQVKPYDSVDELFEFEGQSSPLSKNKKGEDQDKSPQKSLTTSTSTSQEDDDDESESSVSGTNGKHSGFEKAHQCHSDGNHSSISSSKIAFQHSMSCDESASNEKLSTKELIPLYPRNQNIHPIVQTNYINSKIVLFIQMQICDTTLHHWLRYRDHTIIEESSEEKKDKSNSLNDLGQHQCWHLFKQLLAAVEYLHSQSFVHRDIKPRNIFVTMDSKDPSSVQVKLGDFGLATLLDSESTPDSPEEWKNDDSTGVGTALYAPPEQLNSNRCTATDKSDSYSLGIVLFELFNVFPTEMERYCCLSDLRIRLKVDEQFAEYYSFEANIIEQLVTMEKEKRPSAGQILTIYSKEIQQRMKKQQSTKRQMLIEQLQEKLRDKDRRIEQLELELERKQL